MKAVNQNLYKTFTPEILQKSTPWLIQQIRKTDEITKTKTWPTVSEWTSVLESWQPMLESFERVKSVEEAQLYEQIIAYLSDLASKVLNKMVESLNSEDAECVGFDQDDTFIEHIESSNSKSIKEILKPILTLVAMSASTDSVLSFLTSKLKTIFDEQRT